MAYNKSNPYTTQPAKSKYVKSASSHQYTQCKLSVESNMVWPKQEKLVSLVSTLPTPPGLQGPVITYYQVRTDHDSIS